MRTAVLAAALATILAVPLAAALPLDMETMKADLTRKITRRAAPPAINPLSFEGRLLGAHNAERKRLGIAPLSWSPQLATQAATWAKSLAANGAFEHSKERQGAGENLWMGTSGFYSPEAMIGAFVDEKQYFHPGKFPDVSTTGKWSDVGHYTQLIWPATRQVGCAKAVGKGNDVLVCRYLPAGNIIGDRVP